MEQTSVTCQFKLQLLNQTETRDYCLPCHVTWTAWFLASCMNPVSYSFRPSHPVIIKIKAFLATRSVICAIQTFNLLLEKENRAHIVSESQKSSNHCFSEGQAQGRMGPLLYCRMGGAMARWSSTQRSDLQHLVPYKHSWYWSMQACHTSTALGGTGMALHAIGTTEVL